MREELKQDLTSAKLQEGLLENIKREAKKMEENTEGAVE